MGTYLLRAYTLQRTQTHLHRQRSMGRAEDDMAAAIAASLADTNQGEGNRALISEWAKEVDRAACTRLDEHQPEHISQGTITQLNTLDQHSGAFHEMIRQLHAPPSSCGAFSCANAVILSRGAAEGGEAVLAALQDERIV